MYSTRMFFLATHLNSIYYMLEVFRHGVFRSLSLANYFRYLSRPGETKSVKCIPSVAKYFLVSHRLLFSTLSFNAKSKWCCLCSHVVTTEQCSISFVLGESDRRTYVTHVVTSMCVLLTEVLVIQILLNGVSPNLPLLVEYSLIKKLSTEESKDCQ